MFGTDMIVFFVFIKGVACSRAEDELLVSLFSSYNVVARPVQSHLDTLNVTFGLTLSQVIDVDEKKQILVTRAWVRQVWYNPFLSWQSHLYNNITEINVEPTKIWKPDLVLYNNADEDKKISGNLNRLKTRVILRYDGRTTWLSTIILKSKCIIDVRHFPFDTQSCPMKFGSWTYDKDRLNLLSEGDSAVLDKYSKNFEWRLASANAVRNEEKYHCCPEIYPDVTFTIILQRRSLCYVFNLIFPTTIIGMLTMLSFLLPAESGERILLAVNLLLAMIVFMLVVTEIMPETSDVIPLVGVFFGISLLEMVLIIIVLCYIMRLHHKTPQDPPMTIWMRRFVLDWLSRAVRVRSDGPIKPTRLQKEEDLKSFLKTANIMVGEKQPRRRRKTKRENKPSTLVLYKIDIILERVKHVDENQLRKEEWRIVAMTIDRCLLVVFTLLFVLTLVGCFSLSPGYVT